MKLRNFNLLIDCIEKLVDNNITNFEVYFAGASKEDLKKIIREKSINIDKISNNLIFSSESIGSVRFYDIIESGDFILWNIDKECVCYERYLHNSSTGTFGLALGFNKVSIIDAKLSEQYGFNESNAILYTGDSLYDAMKRSIEMSDTEFYKLTDNTIELKERLEEESLNNMKRVFGEVSV
jgi:hypothetical protein